MDAANISPAKRNPRGKFIGTGQKNIIINLYKEKLKQQAEDPDSRLSYNEMIIQISKASGIGQRTICMTLAEYKKRGTVTSPNRKKIRSTIIENVSDFDKNVIRQKVYSFWFNRQIPTLLKILTAVNEDESLPNFKRSSFHKLLKSLNFEYVKINQHSALLEGHDIVNWRQRYLSRIVNYRQRGRPIYYLGETWINVDETTRKQLVDQSVKSPQDSFIRGIATRQTEPSGKELIALNIGSSDGFVPGGLLCFVSKSNSSDYRHEMDDDTFYEWFVKTVPLLKENAVIVMDNASYHSVKKHPIPVMSWKKHDIINWLELRGDIINYPMVKAQLLERVELLKPQYDTYIIDEFANENNKTVLRLPPHHCELNPIELAWSSVKNYVQMNNTTFKLEDVQQLLVKGVEHVTAEMWTEFVCQVRKEEGKLYDIDFIIDDILDGEPEEEGLHVLSIKTCDTSPDSDSDF